MMKANVKRSTLAIAFAIAVAADAIQVGFMPLFFEGIASPLNNALDVVVCIILTLMLGWHISFIPTFVMKLIPFVEIAPTWTIAVLIASRSHWKATAGDVPPIINGQNANVVDVEASVEKQPDPAPQK